MSYKTQQFKLLLTHGLNVKQPQQLEKNRSSYWLAITQVNRSRSRCISYQSSQSSQSVG